jgi:putative transposase
MGITPAQRHAGQDGHMLAERHALYQAAREQNPRRWSRQTRDWTPMGAVTLNPERQAVVGAALSDTRLSCSAGEPAFPSRPGHVAATTRNAGDGRSGATRSQAPRSKPGEDGEHRTFPAASIVAHFPHVGGSLLGSESVSRKKLE